MKTRKNTKTILLILIFFVVTTSISFSFFDWNKEEESNENTNIFNFKWITNEHINVEKWVFAKTNIKAPGGIVFLDGYLYVTDKVSNTIVVLDKDGNFKRNSLESNLYLFEPSIIKTDGEHLYVIDSGYNQLKIISKDFELIHSINLPAMYLGDQYWDLELISEKIYLTAASPIIEATGIFELDKNGTVHQFGKKFVGYLSNFGGLLMAINAMEYFDGRFENNQQIRGVESGRNGLFQVSDDDFIKKFSYVNEYTPLDFLLVNKQIYVFSNTGSCLDKYTLEGQYLETLLELEYKDVYIQLESMDDSILLVRPTEDIIYKIDLN